MFSHELVPLNRHPCVSYFASSPSTRLGGGKGHAGADAPVKVARVKVDLCYFDLRIRFFEGTRKV